MQKPIIYFPIEIHCSSVKTTQGSCPSSLAEQWDESVQSHGPRLKYDDIEALKMKGLTNQLIMTTTTIQVLVLLGWLGVSS